MSLQPNAGQVQELNITCSTPKNPSTACADVDITEEEDR